MLVILRTRVLLLWWLFSHDGLLLLRWVTKSRKHNTSIKQERPPSWNLRAFPRTSIDLSRNYQKIDFLKQELLEKSIDVFELLIFILVNAENFMSLWLVDRDIQDTSSRYKALINFTLPCPASFSWWKL